jgi:hypothetical protein
LLRKWSSRANPRGTRAQTAEEQQGSGNSSTFSSAVGSNLSTDFRLLLLLLLLLLHISPAHKTSSSSSKSAGFCKEVDTQQKQQRRIHYPNLDFFLKMLKRR